MGISPVFPWWNDFMLGERKPAHEKLLQKHGRSTFVSALSPLSIHAAVNAGQI